MDQMKRKMILKEIEYWRSSRLLPEQYCDFLRNLYIEDDAPETTAVGEPGARFRLRPPSPKSILYVLGLASLLLLIYLYFTSFHPVMQTGLSIMLILLLIAIGIRRRDTKPMLAFASLGFGCLLSLFLGLLILEVNGLSEPVWTVALVAGCGLLWIAVGIVSRISVLHLCGQIALLLSYLWLIRQFHPDPAWITLQLYAIPVSLVFYALGKKLYAGLNSSGFILLIAAAIHGVAPEAYGIIFTDMPGILVQSALFIKMVIIGVLVWSHWNGKKDHTEWLSEQD